jgi:hypothetical protein
MARGPAKPILIHNQAAWREASCPSAAEAAPPLPCERIRRFAPYKVSHL